MEIFSTVMHHITDMMTSRAGFILLAVIILSFVFDYINSFHDAANSIATIVATKVLSPFKPFYGLPFGFSLRILSRFII